MQRVALYKRVSTEEQLHHGLSLAEQDRSLEAYAKEHNMMVVGKYEDGGISGRKRYTKRPELLRLLEDVKAGKIDIILFIKLDRWFRSVGDYYEVQRILDDNHVSWCATQEDYETMTASGRFKVNIMLSVAQDEADRTSERIKFVFDGKRERGEAVSGAVPLGYKIVDKKIVLDEEFAPTVRRFFDIYLETGSARKVLEAFPELHLHRSTLLRTLKNPAYTGHCQGVEVPALITNDERERVQNIMKNYTRNTSKRHVYLFTGLLFCAECGHRLGGKPYYLSDGTARFVYHCFGRNDNNGCQNGKHINEKVIEQYLLDHIDIRIQTLIQTKERHEEAISYKSKRDAIKRKLAKLLELYMDELISKDEYKKKYEALQNELAAIPEDRPAVNVDKLTETFFENWQDIYIDLPREEKQAFWKKTIKDIKVNGNEVIDFNFI